MYARSTTFRGDPSSVDAGITFVRDEVMPALEQMEGCVGLSLLVDRESGRCIATSAWESEEAMRATEGRVASIRDRGAERFGGDAEVGEWEIAVLHRVRPSTDRACARVTWLRIDPAEVDRQVDVFRMSVLSRLEDLPGFCSASLLVNRRSGLAASAVTYEDRKALLATRDAADRLRTDATSEVGAQILEVAEFELVFAHLRVPETV